MKPESKKGPKPCMEPVFDPQADFKTFIRSVPDFPKPGINFYDITNLIKVGPVFKRAINEMASKYSSDNISAVVSIEARGFIIGAALANNLGCGIIPVRKKGKLPWKVYRNTYMLEYGTDTLEIHQDACLQGQKLLIVDDVIATGGTVKAVVDLLREMKAEVVGAAFLLELSDLKGREKLGGVPVFSLLKY